MSALRCPTDHRSQDPPELVIRADVIGDDQRVAATIADGHCPACPTVALVHDTIILYSRPVTVGRCVCCQAAWRMDRDTWECLHMGRLVAVP
jgi:prepilin signal peptidase PulO-like enzyme (type II secretory pathway)